MFGQLEQGEIMGRTLLAKVEQSVDETFTGRYMTRCWSVDQTFGTYIYKTQLHSTTGPIVWTEVSHPSSGLRWCRISIVMVVLVDVDPGRGYLLSEWDDETASWRTDNSLSPAFCAAVAAARDSVRNSPYIERTP